MGRENCDEVANWVDIVKDTDHVKESLLGSIEGATSGVFLVFSDLTLFRYARANALVETSE